MYISELGTVSSTDSSSDSIAEHELGMDLVATLRRQQAFMSQALEVCLS